MENGEFIASQTARQHNSAGKWNSRLYSYSIRWIPISLHHEATDITQKIKGKQDKRESRNRIEVMYFTDWIFVYVLRMRFCVWYSWMCEIINHYIFRLLFHLSVILQKHLDAFSVRWYWERSIFDVSELSIRNLIFDRHGGGTKKRFHIQPK